MFGSETISRSAQQVADTVSDVLRDEIQLTRQHITHDASLYLEPVRAEAEEALSAWKTAGQAVTISAYLMAFGIVALCAVHAYIAWTDR